MALGEARKKTMPGKPDKIPDKLYFRIGEVARLCGVPAYVLRFWESEFPNLKPNKGGTGQRLYRRRDVELALRIKQLLYDEGYTIAGARQAFKTEQRQKDAPATLFLMEETPDRSKMEGIRREVRSLVEMLSQPPGTLTTTTKRRASGRKASKNPEDSGNRGPSDRLF